MANFTLHSECGDFLHASFRTLESAKKLCDKYNSKCCVYETYHDKSPWDSTKIVPHGKKVYCNFKKETR